MSVAGAQLPGTQHNSAVQQISSPSTVVAAAAAAASVKPHPTDLAHLAAGSPDHPEPSNALASAAEAEAAATDAEDAAAEAAEAAEADCHSISPQMQFYRTSYKLSQQQVTLPRGIYSLPPRANLPVQLYVAVHPQDWNCDQYVADRAASLAVLNPQGYTPQESPQPAAAVPAAVAADHGPAALLPISSDPTSSPHQGSCSPPHVTSPTQQHQQGEGEQQEGTARHSMPADLAAVAAAAVAAASELEMGEVPAQLSSAPDQEQQQQQQDLVASAAAQADAQELLWSAAAAAVWAQGFTAESILLGPFQAVAKAQSGPREGMCRISRVQHGGQLKGIWHNTNHRAVLYEKVGVTLLVHLKPRLPEQDSSSNSSSSSKKRKSAKLYSLPGEGHGHQILPGSVTEVAMHAKVCSTQSGTVPLKLPKALVLSQFSHSLSLPKVVPLDIMVDGQPAELTMHLQSTNSSSTIRVQREAQISQLPRHKAYCLAGLASAGLGAFNGYIVTKISAPGGEKIVLHLSSPAAQAGAAGTATLPAAAAAAGGERKAGNCQANASSPAPAAAAGAAGEGTQDGQAAAGPAPAAAAAAGINSQQSSAPAVRRSFWLQRLTRSHELAPLPAAAPTAAAAANGNSAAEAGAAAGERQAAASSRAGTAAAAGGSGKATTAPASGNQSSTIGSSRLDMFKAILQRQQQQQQAGPKQQQQQHRQAAQQVGLKKQQHGQQAVIRQAVVSGDKGTAAASSDSSLHSNDCETTNGSSGSSGSTFTACTVACGTSVAEPLCAATPAAKAAAAGAVASMNTLTQQQHLQPQHTEAFADVSFDSSSRKRCAQKSRLGQLPAAGHDGVDGVSTRNNGGSQPGECFGVVDAVALISSKRQKRGAAA